MLSDSASSCVYFEFCRFFRLVTGSEYPPLAEYVAGFISVQFMGTDALISATCQLKLTLPTQFPTYSEFTNSLVAVIPEVKYAFTMV